MKDINAGLDGFARVLGFDDGALFVGMRADGTVGVYITNMSTAQVFEAIHDIHISLANYRAQEREASDA